MGYLDVSKNNSQPPVAPDPGFVEMSKTLPRQYQVLSTSELKSTSDIFRIFQETLEGSPYTVLLIKGERGASPVKWAPVPDAQEALNSSQISAPQQSTIEAGILSNPSDQASPFVTGPKAPSSPEGPVSLEPDQDSDKKKTRQSDQRTLYEPKGSIIWKPSSKDLPSHSKISDRKLPHIRTSDKNTLSSALSGSRLRPPTRMLERVQTVAVSIPSGSPFAHMNAEARKVHHFDRASTLSPMLSVQRELKINYVGYKSLMELTECSNAIAPFVTERPPVKDLPHLSFCSLLHRATKDWRARDLVEQVKTGNLSAVKAFSKFCDHRAHDIRLTENQYKPRHSKITEIQFRLEKELIRKKESLKINLYKDTLKLLSRTRESARQELEAVNKRMIRSKEGYERAMERRKDLPDSADRLVRLGDRFRDFFRLS